MSLSEIINAYLQKVPEDKRERAKQYVREHPQTLAKRFAGDAVSVGILGTTAGGLVALATGSDLIPGMETGALLTSIPHIGSYLHSITQSTSWKEEGEQMQSMRIGYAYDAMKKPHTTTCDPVAMGVITGIAGKIMMGEFWKGAAIGVIYALGVGISSAFSSRRLKKKIENTKVSYTGTRRLCPDEIPTSYIDV